MPLPREKEEEEKEGEEEEDEKGGRVSHLVLITFLIEMLMIDADGCIGAL